MCCGPSTATLVDMHPAQARVETAQSSRPSRVDIVADRFAMIGIVHPLHALLDGLIDLRVVRVPFNHLLYCILTGINRRIGFYLMNL